MHLRGGPGVVMRQGTLHLFAPRGDGPVALGGGAEDEAQQDVNAWGWVGSAMLLGIDGNGLTADGKEEEGGDEGEIIDKVGQDCRADPVIRGQ